MTRPFSQLNLVAFKVGLIERNRFDMAHSSIVSSKGWQRKRTTTRKFSKAFAKHVIDRTWNRRVHPWWTRRSYNGRWLLKSTDSDVWLQLTSYSKHTIKSVLNHVFVWMLDVNTLKDSHCLVIDCVFTMKVAVILFVLTFFVCVVNGNWNLLIY